MTVIHLVPDAELTRLAETVGVISNILHVIGAVTHLRVTCKSKFQALDDGVAHVFRDVLPRPNEPDALFRQ